MFIKISKLTRMATDIRYNDRTYRSVDLNNLSSDTVTQEMLVEKCNEHSMRMGSGIGLPTARQVEIKNRLKKKLEEKEPKPEPEPKPQKVCSCGRKYASKQGLKRHRKKRKCSSQKINFSVPPENPTIILTEPMSDEEWEALKKKHSNNPNMGLFVDASGW